MRMCLIGWTGRVERKRHHRHRTYRSRIQVRCLALSGVDLRSLADRMAMGIIKAVFRLGLGLLIERTSSGLKHAKAAGEVFGRPPVHPVSAYQILIILLQRSVPRRFASHKFWNKAWLKEAILDAVSGVQSREQHGEDSTDSHLGGSARRHRIGAQRVQCAAQRARLYGRDRWRHRTDPGGGSQTKCPRTEHGHVRVVWRGRAARAGQHPGAAPGDPWAVLGRWRPVHPVSPWQAACRRRVRTRSSINC